MEGGNPGMGHAERLLNTRMKKLAVRRSRHHDWHQCWTYSDAQLLALWSKPAQTTHGGSCVVTPAARVSRVPLGCTPVPLRTKLLAVLLFATIRPRWPPRAKMKRYILHCGVAGKTTPHPMTPQYHSHVHLV